MQGVPGGKAKISHTLRPKMQNGKQKQHCNTFNKDFKNGPHHTQKNFFKSVTNLGEALACHIAVFGEGASNGHYESSWHQDVALPSLLWEGTALPADKLPNCRGMLWEERDAATCLALEGSGSQSARENMTIGHIPMCLQIWQVDWTERGKLCEYVCWKKVSEPRDQ